MPLNAWNFVSVTAALVGNTLIPASEIVKVEAFSPPGSNGATAVGGLIMLTKHGYRREKWGYKYTPGGAGYSRYAQYSTAVVIYGHTSAGKAWQFNSRAEERQLCLGDDQVSALIHQRPERSTSIA